MDASGACTSSSAAGSSAAVTEAAEARGRLVMDGMVEAAGGDEESANVAPGHFHALRYEGDVPDVRSGSVRLSN